MNKKIENEIFIIEESKYGWVIKHKSSGKTMGINYTCLPLSSSSDFLFGFAKCLSLVENWI